MTIFNSIKERIDGYHLIRFFELKPKADFVVKRKQKHSRRRSASAEYDSWELRGRFTNQEFFIVPPTFDVMKIIIKYSDESTFLHEANLGHHINLSYNKENTDVARNFYIQKAWALCEGWGFYCREIIGG